MKASPCRAATLSRWARKVLVFLVLWAALIAANGSSQPDSAAAPTTAVNWTCRTNCRVAAPSS
jgi:hypothetical protein